MLIRYQDLTSLNMIATDGSTHPVSDVMVREDDLRAAYAVVDIGAWLANHHVMVGIERFGEPDVRASRWPADIVQHELERKPEPEAQEGASPRGPGRRTIVLPALLRASGHGGADAPVPAQADPRAEGTLRAVGDMMTDVAVAAEDGPAGKLMGLIFDTDRWTPSHMIIETGGEGLPETQRVAPMEMAGRIDWDGGEIRLNVSRARVYESPDLYEVDWLESKWYNRVLAYYGLQS